MSARVDSSTYSDPIQQGLNCKVSTCENMIATKIDVILALYTVFNYTVFNISRRFVVHLQFYTVKSSWMPPCPAHPPADLPADPDLSPIPAGHQ